VSIQDGRVLSRPAILDAISRGEILCEPFDDRCVKGCSIDVRLGEWYYQERCPAFADPNSSLYGMTFQRDDRAAWQSHALPVSNTERPNISCVPLLNPYDKASVEHMWGKPWKAQPLGYDLPGIKSTTPVIIMPPKSVFLGHTMEFIGSLSPSLTFMVKARSSTGRNRIRICACAGWGDQGYANRITLELANDSEAHHVILVPGRRIGQIVFIPTTPLPEEQLYFNNGKYSTQQMSRDAAQVISTQRLTYEEMEANWKPEEMLPRNYLDWELSE
jgi:dCTP deaminase